jgi:hypothetical protein
MSRGTRQGSWILAAALAVACGGAAPPPEEPTSPAEPELSVDEVEQPELSSSSNSEGASDKTGAGAENKGAEQPAAEPEFKEGASVQEAISAVPQGTARINLDQETLGRPLTNPAVYDSCKLAPSQHFKLKVAIWKGKAVGVDVETQPPNKRAAECIDKVIRGITWDDKVPSLNTVEYSL